MTKKRIMISSLLLGIVFVCGIGSWCYVKRGDEAASIVTQETMLPEKSGDDKMKIEAVSAYYVAVGSVKCQKEDLLESVSVVDENGEWINDTMLSIELPWFQTDREGQYLATITARQSEVMATEKVPVYVLEREAMTEHILESKEKDDAFSYEIFCDDTGKELESLSENDVEAAFTKTQPSAVNFYFPLQNGGHGYGNGFVIDLTEDAVYIASNYHVVYAFDTKAEVRFSDGTKITDYEMIGGDENVDVAFVKIDKAAFSEESFEVLAEPSISLVRAKSMKEGETLIRSSLSKDGTMQCEEGTFLEYDYELYNGKRYTTFTAQMSEGNSGSPVYDGYGNLISMCVGVGTEDGLKIMCGVKLEDMITVFEKVTGHSLYAY